MGEVPSVGAGYRQQSWFIFSKYICKALLNFIASDSQEVTEQHLEKEAFDDDYLDSVCGSSPFCFSPPSPSPSPLLPSLFFLFPFLFPFLSLSSPLCHTFSCSPLPNPNSLYSSFPFSLVWGHRELCCCSVKGNKEDLEGNEEPKEWKKLAWLMMVCWVCMPWVVLVPCNIETSRVDTMKTWLNCCAWAYMEKHTHYPELKVTANTHVTMMAHKPSSVVAVSYCINWCRRFSVSLIFLSGKYIVYVNTQVFISVKFSHWLLYICASPKVHYCQLQLPLTSCA